MAKRSLLSDCLTPALPFSAPNQSPCSGISVRPGGFGPNIAAATLATKTNFTKLRHLSPPFNPEILLYCHIAKLLYRLARP